MESGRLAHLAGLPARPTPLPPLPPDTAAPAPRRAARNARVQRQQLRQGQRLRGGVEALQQLGWIGSGRSWRGFRHSGAIFGAIQGIAPT